MGSENWSFKSPFLTEGHVISSSCLHLVGLAIVPLLCFTVWHEKRRRDGPYTFNFVRIVGAQSRPFPAAGEQLEGSESLLFALLCLESHKCQSQSFLANKARRWVKAGGVCGPDGHKTLHHLFLVARPGPRTEERLHGLQTNCAFKA